MTKIILLLFLISLVIISIKCDKDWSDDMKPEKWNKNGKDNIDRILNRKLNTKVAKNILFYLGDGMGMPTVCSQ